MFVRKRSIGVQAGNGLSTRDFASQIEQNPSMYCRSSGTSTSFLTYDDICTNILWSKDRTLQWCLDEGLISSKRKCHLCDCEMQLVQTSDRKDGVKWECRRQFNGKRHKSDMSIRKGSWFKQSNLSLEETLKFTYWWSVNLTQTQIRNQIRLSPNTAVDWDMFC